MISEPESAFTLWLLFFGLFSAQNIHFSRNFLKVSTNFPRNLRKPQCLECFPTRCSGNHSFLDFPRSFPARTWGNTYFLDFVNSGETFGETFGELDLGNHKTGPYCFEYRRSVPFFIVIFSRAHCARVHKTLGTLQIVALQIVAGVPCP